MDKYIGKKISDRYEILEIIGIGGMANVYRAHDILEDRIVAVKILRDEYSTNEDFKRRFKNESKAIAALSHPNIVNVYDVVFTDDMQCIIMEYIDGITLKEYIEQQGTVKWKEAVHFTVQILRALQHAHDKGIVHRDIKPHNIMFLADGTVKIMDFGIARFARSEISTITDKAIGSVHYISPEQAKGDVTDGKTDIYSVGVMLFEMLTGKLPFEADSPVSVAIKQIQSEPLKPREINPAIPEGLEEITMRAMQKDVTKRYQSAAEMLRDLDEFKRNPLIVFGYQAMDMIDAPGQSKKVAGKTAKRGKGQNNTAETDKKTPIVPILGGVAAAFVVVSILFIGIMIYFNNPFTTVAEVEVPNLVGEVYENAKKSEKYQDFDIQIESSDYNNDYPKGTIYEQLPKEGRSVKIGSIIKVKVSLGPLSIVLDSYAGREATAVFAELQDLGLQPKEVKIYDDQISEGYVVYTDPGEGANLTSGDEVTVYVSMGSEHKQVAVPDLYGLTLEEARAQLSLYNLELGNFSYETSRVTQDTIFAQDPEYGTMVEEGTKVNVIISNGSTEMKSVQVYVQLPEEDRTVVVSAEMNGEEVDRETINPAEVRVWKPTFRAEGGTERVIIYIDGEEYQRFEVDFDNESYTPLD